MRRTLLALSVLCPLVVAGVAAAEPTPPGTGSSTAPGTNPSTPAQTGSSAPQGTGTLTAWAFTGSEPMPVNRADIAVTPCDATQVVATLVSGADGRATVALPVGCYEAKVVTVPGGCGLAVTDPVKVTVSASREARADFRFRCA
ncbi:hypothetical protein ACFWU5_19850 [Nocardia sp. NPDC058640]|uniref:hypothetical protein n=1 Tax=Nocardia sp. NPDC058640 TaxID=3346571 RepID=UPI003662D74B